MTSSRILNAKSFATLVILATAVPSVVSAADVDFSRDVAPIFSVHCAECHGDEEPEGGLRLTSRTNVLARGDSGEPSVVPSQPDASELLRRVTAGEEERMPPDGDPLTAEQTDVIRRWIEQGAQWPEQSGPKHWSYVKPEQPALPAVRQEDWAHNEIDRFILAKLESQQPPLSPSPMAEPAKRLRRVYLDLIGLPPSIETLDAFLADPSTEHYKQIVDQLLVSPRYGEKWARQWLDLARYADSNGFQADQFRNIWAYRDWIIQAMNDDMPFDEFTIAQLAGDLLPDATLEQKIATGFQRCTTCNVEAGVDPEENRVNQVIDRVNTFGTIWLGSTLECAQCHNHKYDPFTQQDYYQLFAFFNNTPLEVKSIDQRGVSFEVAGPQVELPLDESIRQERAKFEAQRERIEQKITAREAELASAQSAWETELQASLASSPVWHDVEIAAFESQGGATFERPDDRSLLVTGPVPDKDTYTVTIETDLVDITGLKIEMLADDSLPKKGPGRASPRPNVLVNELDVEAVAKSGGEPQPVSLHTATADFSQTNWDVTNAIDGDPKSGWGINPQFGKDHWATFLTTEPIGWQEGSVIRMQLHQNYGGGRTIGRLRVSLMTGDPGAGSLPEDIREILTADPDKRTPKQSKRLAAYHGETDTALGPLNKQIGNLDKRLKAFSPDTTLVMTEMDEPRESMIFRRGNFLDPLAKVTPTTPAVLHPLTLPETGEGTADRRALAEWVASEDNPLIGRVTVNRWWAEFFGQGIVATPEDFGTQGDLPTHSELLDWLAVEFVEHGWSMKHIHRLIVTSAAYQQDSAVTAKQLRRDPYNKLLTRGPRFRLPAETIRDNGLAIAGLLSAKMGGPPVYPPQPENIWRHVGRNAPKYATDTDEDRFRRGIYVVWRRSAPYPSFVNFDAPDRGACVVLRSRTNTPLQALTLLNDPAYVEMAQALAVRLETDNPDMSDRQRIEHGFRLCTSRQPTTEEVGTLLDLFSEELSRLQAISGAAEKIVTTDAPGLDIDRLAAWFFVANTLLNLDETVTKG